MYTKILYSIVIILSIMALLPQNMAEKESNSFLRRKKQVLCLVQENNSYLFNYLNDYFLANYIDHAFVLPNGHPLRTDTFDAHSIEFIEIINLYSRAIEKKCSQLFILSPNFQFLGNPRVIIQHELFSKKRSIRFGILEGQYSIVLDIEIFEREFKSSMTYNEFLKSLVTPILEPSHLVGRHVLKFCGFSMVYMLNSKPLIIQQITGLSNEHIGSVNSFKKIPKGYMNFNSSKSCNDFESEALSLPEFYLRILKQKSNLCINGCGNVPSYQIDGKPSSYLWRNRDEIIFEGKIRLKKYLSLLNKDSLQSLPKSTREQGIVMLSYDNVFNETYFNVKFIREQLKSTLPIQVFHFNEINSTNQKSLEQVSNVNVISLSKIGLLGIELTSEAKNNYHYKLAAILASNFENILYLDSDCTPIKDPSSLFLNRNYLEHGLVLFQDMWKTNFENPIFDIFEVQCMNELEIEAGQWLVNKSQHLQTLVLSYLILMDHKFWMDFFFGDKDVVRWSAKYLMNTIFIEPSFMKSYGFVYKQYKCGHAMVHYMDGEASFFHANLIKYAGEISSSNFQGYQDYGEITNLNYPRPKFYGISGWRCVSMDESKWIDNPSDINEFIIKYLSSRNIQ
eukprot:NODE_8_length_66115_cov_0.981823.p7 type:complete len:621 gc:universal NODE_8_length_66115_cov_0.981823:61881-60019(-)